MADKKVTRPSHPRNAVSNTQNLPADISFTASVLPGQKHGSGGLSPDPEKASRQLEALQPTKWKPGQSGNPNGRPKDMVKAIGKRIARAKVSKILTDKQKKLAQDLEFDPDDITLLEHLMLKLATSANPQKIEIYLQRTFGKVPNINITAEINAQLVMKFRSKFTDSELEAIASGADALELLLDKLPDVDESSGMQYIDEDSIDAEYSE